VLFRKERNHQNEFTFILQALHRPDACFLLFTSYLDTVLLLERETYVCVVCHCLQIHAVAKYDLAGELRGSHLGYETVRQVSNIEDHSSYFTNRKQ